MTFIRTIGSILCVMGFIPASVWAFECKPMLYELASKAPDSSGAKISQLEALGYSYSIARNLVLKRPGTAQRIIDLQSPALTVYRGISIGLENYRPTFFDTVKDRRGRTLTGSWVSPDFYEAIHYGSRRGIILELEIPPFAFRDPSDISRVNPQGYWQGFIPSHYVNGNLNFYTRRIGILNPNRPTEDVGVIDPYVLWWMNLGK